MRYSAHPGLAFAGGGVTDGVGTRLVPVGEVGKTARQDDSDKGVEVRGLPVGDASEKSEKGISSLSVLRGFQVEVASMTAALRMGCEWSLAAKVCRDETSGF
jgi:hypothetical protein